MEYDIEEKLLIWNSEIIIYRIHYCDDRVLILWQHVALVDVILACFPQKGTVEGVEPLFTITADA